MKLAAVLLLLCADALCQTKVPVFVSGTGGYRIYRIPAIIALANGDLLAFAEGRVEGGSDFGNVDIVMKRSRDHGKSWSELAVVAGNDSLQAGNPAPVVDFLDPAYRNGRVFLFYNTGNNHEGEVRKGNGVREVWYTTSADGGATWSAPENITAQVHRPNQPAFNQSYDFKEDWRSYANAPGHALQISSGEYKGRLFVPANHSSGDPQPRYRDYAAHGYFTDDHGRTFHLAESVPMPGSNESTAAELSDGTVMMNMRNQSGDIRARIIALSKSGGARWDTAWYEKKLPDPVCEGSILTIGKRSKKNILAFCNAADTVNRDNLTLRISFDDGRSWKENIVVDKSAPGKEERHAAYSDIVKVGTNKVGVLYERENYSAIVFTVLRWRD
ncbi:MAG TPA: sialidase family protein [Chryseosolibacter sp.]